MRQWKVAKAMCGMAGGSNPADRTSLLWVRNLKFIGYLNLGDRALIQRTDLLGTTYLLSIKILLALLPQTWFFYLKNSPVVRTDAPMATG